MSQARRIHDIITLLENSRYPVPQTRFLTELDISRSTFKRDLEILRDEYRAPISWHRGVDGEPGGYSLDDKGWESSKGGMPRVWFTATEIQSLLMIDKLAATIGPGLLTEHLQPLITRVTLMLGAGEDDPDDVRSRIRILQSASKRRSSDYFETVASATVKRHRLQILYFTRSRNERSERIVSPQQMIHYRENWYLVAWCHKAEGMRVFALDAIEEAVTLQDKAKSVPKKELEEVIGRDFGLFSGKHRQWAKLVFTPKQARWVASEIWHPDQKVRFLEDGSYMLEVPYSDLREIALEILRFGPEVEVIEPPDLRGEVAERLKAAAARYS